ncbi:MAG: hypothetical protein Tsb0018_10300 [Opitutales bacterium]
MTAPTPTPSLSRREFVSSGSKAFAGLGILGLIPSTLQSASPPAQKTNNQSASFFEVPMNGVEYALPPLPYAYNALEPSIDEETMRLHHDIHFAGYMKGLNSALKTLDQARAQGNFPEISYWENQLAFNGAGYVLHTVFFQNMGPMWSTTPSENIKNLMSNSFGSFDAFQKQFSAAAAKVQGSGWAILGYQPFGKKLIILQAEKHQNLTQWSILPILALDVWEHAYYLKYQNRRAEYIEYWWKVVNWDNVESRLTSAQSLFVTS